VTATQYDITFATFIAPSDGSWNEVPFLPSPSVVDTVIGGTLNDGRVGRVTTVCYPCTVEPTPSEWYRYLRGGLVPAPEPGPPPCRLGALPGRAPRGRSPLSLTRR
jgi:hypothetical protein